MPRKPARAESSSDDAALETLTLTLPRRWVRQLYQLAEKHKISVSDVAVLMLAPSLSKRPLEIDSHILFFKAVDKVWQAKDKKQLD
ncbi:MAG: hypothetical protein GWN84_10665 [Gammaproteobacteria bacterium]|nr:hypothetical protein [Gammaproteobacteria bacterium]NIR83327.1 hypothetical protein [Gammaproteobacteria bacterium]NIR91127.1 hypothetical protein [Gammaproteobacteria bacterium]NIU04494.1 hypothetical protein [Gammaproteobacteria bacterium]NIW87130.1 hypothetical protein [Gammaproteobacteria bacterium]